MTAATSPVVHRPAPGRYARILPYIARERLSLAGIFALTLAGAGVVALAPWPMKLLVDHAFGGAAAPAEGAERVVLNLVADPGAPATLIVACGVATVALMALQSLLNAALTWRWTAVGHRMLYDLAGDLFARLQSVSLIHHGRRPVGDSLTRVTVDSWCVYKLAASLLVAPMQHLFSIATVGALAWTLNPALTVAVFAVAPALAWSARFFGARLKGRAGRQRVAEARLASFTHHVLSAMPVVKAFTREDANDRAFAGLAEEVVARSREGVLARQAFAATNGAALAVGAAVVLYLGAHQVRDGALTVGGLLVFVAYVQSLRVAFAGLLQSYGDVRTTEASIDRAVEVLAAEDAVREAPDAVILRPPAPGRGLALAFEDVAFGYGDDRPALRGVSLALGAGETVALVGESGAGKTTLASLALRYFDPDSGRVLVDGRDARDYTLPSLRGQIALVLQEPFLLPLSIAENIAYGRLGAGRDEIEAAARAANAHDFIAAMPEGYDTLIGERGADLSGGQRQRIAIARALLKDAPILILDEPTSALDAASEAAVLEALSRLMAGRTTLIIAHRLSTVRDADRICVLKDGRVEECGPPAALLAARGAYWRFLARSGVGEGA